MVARRDQVPVVEESLHREMKTALIIFVKNQRYGQVKTRLAAKLGHDQAFEAYKILVQHTLQISLTIKADKFLFYHEKIEKDEWPGIAERLVQRGDDLGTRMKNAFALLFSKNYDKVLIIGSDCLEITDSIIEQGFSKLDSTDVVIGPARDGGYYLLGLKENSPLLFENIEWSTSKVLAQTTKACKENNLDYSMLELLNDIDEAGDWLKAKQALHGY